MPFKSLCYLQPFGSPKAGLIALNTNVLGTCFLCAVSLGWGAWCGAKTPCLLGRTTAVMVNPPFVHCLLEVGDFD